MGDSREPPSSHRAGGFAEGIFLSGIFPSPFGELMAAAVVCGAAVPAPPGGPLPLWLAYTPPSSHSTGRWPAWTLLLASEVKRGELAGLARCRKGHGKLEPQHVTGLQHADGCWKEGRSSPCLPCWAPAGPEEATACLVRKNACFRRSQPRHGVCDWFGFSDEQDVGSGHRGATWPCPLCHRLRVENSQVSKGKAEYERRPELVRSQRDSQPLRREMAEKLCKMICCSEMLLRLSGRWTLDTELFYKK